MKKELFQKTKPSKSYKAIPIFSSFYENKKTHESVPKNRLPCAKYCLSIINYALETYEPSVVLTTNLSPTLTKNGT